MECPYSSSKGYSTLSTQQEFIKSAENPKDIDLSLNANMDQTRSLNFWQLYSIWGQEPILDIVEAFYKSIYSVSEENGDEIDDIELKQVFVNLDTMRHHINVQAAYWIDAMGGGRYYHGGDFRLTFHHKNRAGPRVMTADGAKRWMSHFQQDHRILPCLISFLETKMKSYAELHNFEFDPTDFELDKFKLEDTGSQVGSTDGRLLQFIT
jgi:truncated hemoglobin YjbI